MKIKYKNAGCQHCLNKIQEQACDLENLESCELDTLNEEIILRSKKGKEKEAYSDFANLVKKIEPKMKLLPEVKFSIKKDECSHCHLDKDLDEDAHKHEHEHSHEDNHFSSPWKKSLLFGGIFLLILAIFTDLTFLKILSYFLVSWDIILRMLKNFKNKEYFDENTLMALASLGAIFLGEYYEASAVILLYKLGEFLQEKAVQRSKDNIKALLALEILSVNLKNGENLKEVHPKEVKIGDIILLKTGESLALDGKIIKGDSFLDLKAINGESKLVDVHENDEVLSGSLNTGKSLEIQVTKLYSDSTISKISTLLKEAMKSRSKSEQFISKFARYYTPIVFALALFVAFLLPLFIAFFSQLSYFSLLKDYINRSLIFLVISCPCALVISVPLAYFAGIGAASKRGILVKASSYLDEINGIQRAAFDKTGTLTKGNFAIAKIENLGKVSDEEFKELLTYSELYSNHPIAKSILNFTKLKVDVSQIKKQEELAGFGLLTQVKEDEILLGNAKLMEKFSVKFQEENSPSTLLYLAKNGEYLGFVEIVDEIKEEAYSMIEFLKEKNIKTILLTGDNERVAEELAKKVKIDEVRAKLLPQDKLKLIKEEKAKGKTLFLGDGINDAPALAAADVGISMGLGSDLAIMSSDIVLSENKLSKVKELFQISAKTRKISLQNIVFSISFKVVILIFALFGFTNMWIAIIADVGISLLAILNSIRILKNTL